MDNETKVPETNNPGLAVAPTPETAQMQGPHLSFTAKKKLVAISIGALLLIWAGVVAWEWSAPRTYAVHELSAAGWVLPALGIQIHGTRRNWTLSTNSGPRIVVRSDGVKKATGFVSQECAIRPGDIQKWEWVPHTHQREAVIRLGNCRLAAVQEVHHATGGNP